MKPVVHEGEAEVARLLGFEGIEPLALGQLETADGGNADEFFVYNPCCCTGTSAWSH